MNSQIKKLLDAKKEENRLLEEQIQKNEIVKIEKKQKKEEKIAIKNKKFQELKTIQKTYIEPKKKEEKVQKVAEEKKIQDNYNELKKKSILTDKFINLVDNIKFDDKDTPKTEKGMATKTKEILERINKKLEKIPEEELEVHYIKKRRLSQSDD